jgi:hypothetical protein
MKTDKGWYDSFLDKKWVKILYNLIGAGFVVLFFYCLAFMGGGAVYP